jgi:hypothetical protein
MKEEFRWIPVSEKLPTNPRLYPVIVSPSFEMEWVQFWFNGKEFEHNYTDRNVTHWLQLPDLPCAPNAELTHP